MFDHVVFGVSDYAVSKAFFLKALEPLHVAIVSEGPLGLELYRPNETSSLCIRREPEAKPSHLHLPFTAKSRQQVEAFYRAALSAGGKDNGSPGLRPHYHASYYAAFVIGPDGHNIETVCHARGLTLRSTGLAPERHHLKCCTAALRRVVGRLVAPR